jgi:hypothetical protein
MSPTYTVAGLSGNGRSKGEFRARDASRPREGSAWEVRVSTAVWVARRGDRNLKRLATGQEAQKEIAAIMNSRRPKLPLIACDGFQAGFWDT